MIAAQEPGQLQRAYLIPAEGGTLRELDAGKSNVDQRELGRRRNYDYVQRYL